MSGSALSSDVRDVVLRAGKLSVVMTLAAGFVGESTDDYLRESDVRVLGKLTRVVPEGSDPINLTRRSTLGLLPSKDIQDLIGTVQGAFDDNFNVEIADAFVEGPAVQILPLAIYV